MTRLKPVDVVIVGGGWAGLLMAKEIATRSSLSVVVLERGPARRLADYASSMDELDYVIRLKMMQNTADETITHRHSGRDQAVPVRQHGSYHPGTGTGGSGEHWGGVSYRFEEDVFKVATSLREKHGGIPQNLTIHDWPVTYEELEPYYWRAEQMLGLSGKAGNLRGRLIEGGNIFESPRMNEYPTPPHNSTYWMTQFHRASAELGYHPYTVPSATLSQAYTNPDKVSRAACVYCGYCQRFGCMIGAKGQPSNTLLPVLQGRKNFTLRNGCWATRVIHREGKAEGVQYIDEKGHEILQPARAVMLTGFTLSNTRLLMLSRIGDPYDPATGKGTLGKNMTHQVQQSTQIYWDKPLNNFIGAGGLGIAFADFEGDRALASDPNVLRGGTFFSSSTGVQAISGFGAIPPGETSARWGSEWKKAALRWYDRMAILRYEGEHLSNRQNSMDLDPTYTDKFGDPLLRVTFDWTELELNQRRFAAGVQTKLAKALNAKNFNVLKFRDHYDVGLYQSTHIQGGAIMGDSPERGVVNNWLQHWRVPNLWVIGGSAFPQNSSGNPTLTVLALGYRAADAFLKRYIKRPGPLA
jgi:gluconate 2-dehydrogenase alpha chain